MLQSVVYLYGSFIYFSQRLDKRMVIGRHCSIHELFHQSIFVLLATSGASNDCYCDSKADAMQTKRGKLDKLVFWVLFIGFNLKTFYHLDGVFFLSASTTDFDREDVEAFPLSFALGNYENFKAIIIIKKGLNLKSMYVQKCILSREQHRLMALST